MKKILSLILSVVIVAVCAFAMVGCVDPGNGKPTLYVYTNAGFPPYEYIDGDKVVGVDMEVMQEVGEVLGYNVVIKDIEFGQIPYEVQSNAMAVGAAGMTKTDERDEVMLASIPYATSIQYVVAPKDSLDAQLVGGKLPLSALATLSNKKIGVQSGTTGQYMVEDAINGTEKESGEHVVGALEGSGAGVFEYTNAIVASTDIGSRVGAVVIDKLPAERICASNSALECYEINAEPEQYVLYFNKNATELVAEVNKVLEVLIANGVIDYFTLKHSGGIVE